VNPTPVARPRPSTILSRSHAWNAPIDAGTQESWEDSDDEEEAAKKAAAAAANKPAPPLRQKGVTKAKIAEREAAEAAKLQERLARESEDPRERKKREMQQQIAQDLENARALLGDSVISDTVAAGGVSLDGSPFAAFPNPKTKDDMEQFAAALSKHIIDNYSNKPLYHHFCEAFVKSLVQPLKDLEVRKCASALTVVANEKQRIAREATTKKGKAKGKPQLGAVGSGGNKVGGSRG